MSRQQRDADAHPTEVRDIHERLLAEAGLWGSTVRTSDGAAVHVVETGTGPPVVFIHGSGSPGLFWLPIVEHLEGMRALVVDRPGFGLSDPAATGVGWVERLLDALRLPTAILVGHSMGGLWALRFALEHPERVSGLTMIGTPSVPGSRAPLPFRLLGTPGARALIARQRETPKSLRQFASMIGEGDTIGAHPDMVELMVAVGNDPVAGRALQQEVRPLISPWALVSRTGFRRGVGVTEDELRGLSVPTLLLWGQNDPVANGDVAVRLQALIPQAEVELFDAGHVPWLGHATAVAAALNEWVARVQG